MVDVRARVLGEARGREVHELLERALLLGAGVRPERREPLFAVGRDRAEEVLEPLPRQRVRIALHVEEDVAGRGRRERGQRVGIDDLVGDFAGGVLADLDRGLRPQRRERRRGQVARAVLRRGRGQCVDGAEPGRDELAALVGPHARDQRQVPVGLTRARAVLGETASRAGRALVVPDLHRQGGGAVLQPRAQPFQQRQEVLDTQGFRAAVAEQQVHVRPGGPARTAQRVGVRGQLHHRGRLRVPGELRVVDLVAAGGVPLQEVGAAGELAVVEDRLVDHRRPGPQRLLRRLRGEDRVVLLDLDDGAAFAPQPLERRRLVRPAVLHGQLIRPGTGPWRARQAGGERLLQHTAVLALEQVGEIGRGVHRRESRKPPTFRQR